MTYGARYTARSGLSDRFELPHGLSTPFNASRSPFSYPCFSPASYPLSYPCFLAVFIIILWSRIAFCRSSYSIRICSSWLSFFSSLYASSMYSCHVLKFLPVLPTEEPHPADDAFFIQVFRRKLLQLVLLLILSCCFSLRNTCLYILESRPDRPVEICRFTEPASGY